MGLAEQFELLELIHRDKAETWLARERNSNRRLLLHRFKETSGLRERLLAMGPGDLIMLVGAEKEGDSYIVVTHDAPALRKFSEWAETRSVVAAPVEKAAPSVSREVQPTPPDPQRTMIMPARAREAQISGEFDLLFNASGPAPVRSPFDDDSSVGPAIASNTGLTNKSFEEPGEFTRMFQTPAVSSANAVPASRNDTPASPPGEFTLMFQPPGATPASNKDALSGNRYNQLPATGDLPTPNRSSSSPGDFTRAFPAMGNPTEPTTPGKVSPGRAMQRPGKPTEDEFANPLKSAADAPTQTYPVRPSLESRKPASNEPGEFTRIFDHPFATPADNEKFANPLPAQPQRPDRPSKSPEMFSRSSEGTPYDSAADVLDHGATGIFVNAKPTAAGSVEPSMPAGPSEYTRIFKQPETPPQEAAKEPEPTKPQATAQAPALPAKNPLPLAIILTILAVAAIALLLYFVLRR